MEDKHYDEKIDSYRLENGSAQRQPTGCVPESACQRLRLGRGRRSFLRGVGLASAAGALASFARPLQARAATPTNPATVTPPVSAPAYPPQSSTSPNPAPTTAPSIARDPADVPAPIANRGPQHVRFDIESVEAMGQLAEGITYQFWTFGHPGKPPQVPGPLLRVRVGDTVEIRFTNARGNMMEHNIDLHAVMGPGGGGNASSCMPGETKTFSFEATTPGLYVYHCATPSVAVHIASGMYGMILIEPAGGLPKVDREFYVMQGEVYTGQAYGRLGEATLSYDKVLAETPEYYVFNGAVDSLTKQHPLKGKVGERIRLLFGVGGPNKIASFHIIGQIMERLYDQASLLAKPLPGVQTTAVPPGGAIVAEFRLVVPGTFALVDHAIARIERGAKGFLNVEGPQNLALFNPNVRT